MEVGITTTRLISISILYFFNFVLVGCDPKPSSQYVHRRANLGRKTSTSETNKEEEKVEEKFKLWKEGPNFDTDLPQNVMALQGKTAYLSCRVYDRGNKTISWIRHHDLHILTVGRYTYTADLRYQSIYNPERDEWILQIKYAQIRDSGRYECQISTQPVRSFFVELKVVDSLPNLRNQNVMLAMNDGKSKESTFNSFNNNNRNFIEPQARILGDSEVFVEVGSVLNLTCEVKNAEEKPAFMLWYHGDKTLDYTNPRGGISVLTSIHSSPNPTSTLLISKVKPRDSGKYSCQPANAQSASVSVHILDGEHQAAIHTNSAKSHLKVFPPLRICVSVFSVLSMSKTRFSFKTVLSVIFATLTVGF